MRRLGVALATTTLLLTACGGADETADATTGTQAPPEDSPATVGGDADSDDGTDSDEGTDRDERTAAGDTVLNRPSEQILAEAGLLVDGAISLGPAGPEDESVNLAMCDYLFGTPEEVAAVVGADAGSQVVLAPGSGFRNNASSGSGPQCLWTVDGSEAFGAAIWSQELGDPVDDDALLASTVLEETNYVGYVAVNPDWDGALGLDEDGAIEWLHHAGTRWGGQSI